MAQLVIRNVEEGVVRALKLRAFQNGRSAEAELREILRKTLLMPPEKSFEEYLASMPDVGEDSDFVRIEGKFREIDP